MPTMAWLDSHISTIRIYPDEKCCVNCKHFYQHYVKNDRLMNGQWYTPTSVGHCVYPRIKERSAEQVCKHFERKDGEDI